MWVWKVSYLAAAVGNDRLVECFRGFLEGCQDCGNVDNGCLPTAHSFLGASLSSLLQQGQEGLGKKQSQGGSVRS